MYLPFPAPSSVWLDSTLATRSLPAQPTSHRAGPEDGVPESTRHPRHVSGSAVEWQGGSLQREPLWAPLRDVGDRPSSG